MPGGFETFVAPPAPQMPSRVSIWAAGGALIAVVAICATVTGLLAPVGAAIGVVATLASLIGLRTTSRHLAGHGLAIVGVFARPRRHRDRRVRGDPALRVAEQHRRRDCPLALVARRALALAEPLTGRPSDLRGPATDDAPGGVTRDIPRLGPGAARAARAVPHVLTQPAVGDPARPLFGGPPIQPREVPARDVSSRRLGDKPFETVLQSGIVAVGCRESATCAVPVRPRLPWSRRGGRRTLMEPQDIEAELATAGARGAAHVHIDVSPGLRRERR